MRKIFTGMAFLLTAVVLYTSCRKVDALPYYENGTAVTLTASKTTITPTPADSTKSVVDFSWTDPKYASDSSTYKYILSIDSSGKNFANEKTITIVGNRTASLTGKELNDILLNYGFKLGVAQSIDVRIISSYGNNNERYISNIVKLSVTPYTDPSTLTTAQTSVTTSLVNANQPSNTFTWTRSFNGYTGTVNYAIQYDSVGKNFANAKEITAGTSLSKILTQGEMNETALNSGVSGGSIGKIEYRIKATTAQGAVAFSNAVAVTIQSYLPLLRFYLPGGYQGETGNGNDWDPGTAPELVRDLRPGLLNNMYYIYIYLPANAEFKVTQGRGWDVNYGGSNGNLEQNGPNFKVTTAGVYRISIDRQNMKYDIREGRMGLVGDASPVGWNPSAAFPTTQMGNPAPNLFIGIANLNTGAWKMIDNPEWNNGSNSVTETRSYGSGGGSGSTMVVNGDNFPAINTAGRYRITWDGRDRDNIKYELHSAAEMRVVGDGIQGVPAWNPGASPQMNYIGNGKWQITLTLVGGKEIKFLGGNDWGAFDYEDNSGGSNATGVPRKIKWEGGDNFKTPAATGTYTITLDEYSQTVTIN